MRVYIKDETGTRLWLFQLCIMSYVLCSNIFWYPAYQRYTYGLIIPNWQSRYIITIIGHHYETLMLDSNCYMFIESELK